MPREKPNAGTLIDREYYTVDEVTALIGMSKSFCYKLVQRLNAELEEMGKITFPGLVPKIYLHERLYCGEPPKRKPGRPRGSTKKETAATPA